MRFDGETGRTRVGRGSGCQGSGISRLGVGSGGVRGGTDYDGSRPASLADSLMVVHCETSTSATAGRSASPPFVVVSPTSAWERLSKFRDWVAEETDLPREESSRAVAHIRSNLLFDRRQLVDDWAAHLGGTRRTADLTPADTVPTLATWTRSGYDPGRGHGGS